jgi:hypothetical protein
MAHMGECNPYMALPDENRNHNRGSVSERHAERMLWSLGFSIGTLICMVVMAILVDYHQPVSSNLVSDRFPFLKVVVPVGAGGLLICLAVLLVVPVVLTGNLRPAWWLIPTTLLVIWFVYFYDWNGLLEFGRPRSDVWKDPAYFALVVRRFEPWISGLILGLLLLELNDWQQKKAAATAGAEIRKIVDEQTQLRTDSKNSRLMGNNPTD